MAKVSIIVPVHNTEEYVGECVESVLNQTYDDIELIVIDDGSTDNSVKRIECYLEDKRIRLIHNPPRGLSHSRQCGIDAASGTYICSIDSDDYISYDYVERMLTALINNDSDIVTCNYVEVRNNGRRRNVYNSLEDMTLNMSAEWLELNYLKALKKTFSSDTWTKMYRLDYVIQSGVRFITPNHFNGTDSLFNSRLLMHEPRYSIITDRLYYHRVVRGSRANRKNKRLQEAFFFLIEELVKECRNSFKGDKTRLMLEIEKRYYTYMDQALYDLAKDHTLFGILDSRKIDFMPLESFIEKCILFENKMHFFNWKYICREDSALCKKISSLKKTPKKLYQKYLRDSYIRGLINGYYR